MKAKKTRIAVVIFTALAGIGAGLGTLPIPSSELPMPPELRPYIQSIGFFGTVLGLIANSIISAIQASEPKE